jgi:hypothetical protein
MSAKTPLSSERNEAGFLFESIYNKRKEIIIMIVASGDGQRTHSQIRHTLELAPLAITGYKNKAHTQSSVRFVF